MFRKEKSPLGRSQKEGYKLKGEGSASHRRDEDEGNKKSRSDSNERVQSMRGSKGRWGVISESALAAATSETTHIVVLAASEMQRSRERLNRLDFLCALLLQATVIFYVFIRERSRINNMRVRFKPENIFLIVLTFLETIKRDK